MQPPLPTCLHSSSTAHQPLTHLCSVKLSNFSIAGGPVHHKEPHAVPDAEPAAGAAGEGAAGRGRAPGWRCHQLWQHAGCAAGAASTATHTSLPCTRPAAARSAAMLPSPPTQCAARPAPRLKPTAPAWPSARCPSSPLRCGQLTWDQAATATATALRAAGQPWTKARRQAGRAAA